MSQAAILPNYQKFKIQRKHPKLQNVPTTKYPKYKKSQAMKRLKLQNVPVAKKG
jgi:hypothetical protein